MDESSITGSDQKIFERCTYTWILHKFSDLRIAYENGICLKSPIFPKEDMKHKWQLCIYPNGTENGKQGVGLFLKKSINDNVFAKFTLYMRNSDGHIIVRRTLEHKFTKKEPDWGLRCIILPVKLPLLFSDDIVEIEAVVFAEIFTLQHFHRTSIQGMYVSQLSRDFTSIFGRDEFSDFIIQLKDSSKIKVHRVILAARSPVFSAMFNHNTFENKHGYAEVIDIDKKTMLKLLQFIYTGSINPLSWDEAKILLFAADKYAILELKEICASVLFHNVTVSNALDILLLAEIHDIPKLKNDAFNYILKRPWKFSDSAMFKELIQKRPTLLAELIIKMSKLLKDKVEINLIA